MASGYLLFCFRIDIGIFWESRMPSRRWDQPCSYQNQKDLPGCLPDTPWFASGYLPGCGVFDALQKLNFLTIPKWQQRPSKFLSRGFERTSYICTSYTHIYDGFHLILTFQRTFFFCFRPASVFLPFCFRYAGKVATCFRSFRGPLEYFFGKPHLA